MPVTGAALNPASAIPMYYQLAQWITRGVEDGTFPAGMVLASEAIMARDLGVSRNTVRRAMDYLADRQTIRRAKGTRHTITTMMTGNAPVPANTLRGARGQAPLGDTVRSNSSNGHQVALPVTTHPTGVH